MVPERRLPRNHLMKLPHGEFEGSDAKESRSLLRGDTNFGKEQALTANKQAS